MTAARRPDVYFTSEYGQAECVEPQREWISIDRCDGLFQLPLVLRPVRDGIWDAASPYGYSGAYAHHTLSPADVDAAWRSAFEELKSRRVVAAFLRHSPLVPQARMNFPHADVVRDHATVAMDVGDIEAAWAHLDSSCRNKIRKARKRGGEVTISVAEPKDLQAGNPFRVLYEATMRRRNAAGHYHFPDEYYDRLAHGLKDGLLLAQGVDDEGVVRSAALFMHHANFLHYHLSGSDGEALRLGLNNLLIWTAAEYASALGAQLMHLGGGVGGDDPLFTFKASFGPQRLAFRATGVVFDDQTYDELSGSTGASAALSGYFPAYRAAFHA